MNQMEELARDDENSHTQVDDDEQLHFPYLFIQKLTSNLGCIVNCQHALKMYLGAGFALTRPPCLRGITPAVTADANALVRPDDRAVS